MIKNIDKPSWDFREINWSSFFNNHMRHSFCGCSQFDKYLKQDWKFDIERLKEAGHKNFDQFYNKSWKLNFQAIIDYISNPNNYYEPVYFVCKWKNFSKKDKEKIQKTLLEQATIRITRWEITRLFEWMEAVFPIFFDQFEIILKALPEILWPENAIKTHRNLNANENEVLKNFLQYWINPEKSTSIFC